MPKALTKKQQQRLLELDQPTLLTIVSQLIDNDPDVRKWVINGWLSEPDEVIKRLESAYKRLARSQTFYDYYAANGYFARLVKDIVQPMALCIAGSPARVEMLAATMLLGFESLTAHVDTSSGSWQDYTDALFDVWLQSLAAQRATRPAEDIADAIVTLSASYDWFNTGMLVECSRAFGSDVFRALGARCEQAGNLRMAAEVFLSLRDINAVKALLLRQKQPDTGSVLSLAALLLDELRSAEAIVLLEEAAAALRPGSAEYRSWGQLLVSALLEEGQKERARKTALEAFSRSPDSAFWLLYLKAGGDEARDFSLFVQQIDAGNYHALIAFLSDTQHYQLLSDIIMDKAPAGIAARIPDNLEGAFWRSLSATLYKQGFAHAAVILRRRLAEGSISRASSKYYSYAAGDAKKAIDYATACENDSQFIDSGTWLKMLYATHFRKYALWDVMQEKIPGLNMYNGAEPILLRKE